MLYKQLIRQYCKDMKHNLYALATVVALNLVPISVEAATVNLDNQGRVTNLFDLNVNGILYNVDFQFDTFQNLFGDLNNLNTEPTFWNQRNSAITARNAVLSELNALNPIPSWVYDDDKGIDFSQFYIPFEVLENSSIPINTAFGDFSPGGEWTIPNIGGSGVDNVGLDRDEMYATFTVATAPVATPEPSILLGLGITLGWGATFKRQLTKKRSQSEN